MESSDKHIDTDLYSRQIGTFGIETMGKLMKMKVVIAGLRGLGVETAKNLILAGPEQVLIYDPDLVRINDLGANFYVDEASVGKLTRAQACVNKLQELNEYVRVILIESEEELINTIQKGIHVFCQTELILGGKYLNPETINQLCREKNVGYISS